MPLHCLLNNFLFLFITSLLASHFTFIPTTISTNRTTLTLQLSLYQHCSMLTVTFYHYHRHSDQFITTTSPTKHKQPKVPNHYNQVLNYTNTSLFSFLHHHITLALTFLPFNIFCHGQCQCSSHFRCHCHHSVCTLYYYNPKLLLHGSYNLIQQTAPHHQHYLFFISKC